MPFCKGEVRSQRVSQFDGNIVKYTKQIVEQQVYKHLKDVKVIKNKTKQKNRKQQNRRKSMEANVHHNEGPVSLFYFIFFLQRFRVTGRLALFQILKLQYHLL